MASRTYLPTLVQLLLLVCSFVTKHRDRILHIIGEENSEALDNLLLACNAVRDIALPFLGTPV